MNQLRFTFPTFYNTCRPAGAFGFVPLHVLYTCRPSGGVGIPTFYKHGAPLGLMKHNTYRRNGTQIRVTYELTSLGLGRVEIRFFL